MAVEHRTISTHGVELHCVLDGPEDGPLVLLLHGFPEGWFGWRHQIPYLASKGFRVVAPDQRGYNDSAKPEAVSDYALDRIAGDAEGLIHALGRQKAYVAGHDWGAMVAWWLGMTRPSLVAKLAILNVPHPAVMQKHLKTNPAQLKRSWYIGFFQLPKLPELAFRYDGGKRMSKMLVETSRPGSFTEADLDQYRAAWMKPGAVTGMLNWYRAAMRSAPERPENLRVTVPTMIIWGVDDLALGVEMVDPSAALCDDVKVVKIDDATHWVQHDARDRVNALLSEHFGQV